MPSRVINKYWLSGVKLGQPCREGERKDSRAAAVAAPFLRHTTYGRYNHLVQAMENRSWAVIPSDFLIDTHFRPSRQGKRGKPNAQLRWRGREKGEAVKIYRCGVSSLYTRHKSKPIWQLSVEQIYVASISDNAHTCADSMGIFP